MEHSRLPYRPELDGLRGLAILGVLLFHLGITSLEGGFLGVDVFFVLSGFLISRLIMVSVKDKQFSFADFYIRRARRLLPALVVAAAFNWVAAAFFLSPVHFERASEAGIFSVLSLANIQSWLSGGYFDTSSAVKPFLHYWSLSVEEQFYLIWPVLIVLCFGRLARKAGLAVLVLVSILSFSALVYWQVSRYDAVFYLMPFRIWEFGLGALIAALGLGLPRPEGNGETRASAYGAILTLIGLVLIITSFLFGHNINHFGAQLAWAALGAVAIIAAPSNPISKFALANRPAVYLGKISYSLYLWHWPVIVYLRYYVGPELTLVWMCVAALTAFGLSVLSYRFVEDRFRRPWNKDVNLDRMAVPAVIAPAALTLVFAASLAWNQSGWMWRLPAQMQSVVKASIKPPAAECERRKFDGATKAMCVFGDKRETIDFAVMGDSHAAGLSAGMTMRMKMMGLTGISQSVAGMVPFLNTEMWSEQGGERGDLNEKFSDVFAAKPEYIILHGRYALYWLTDGAENEHQKLKRYLTPTGFDADKTIEVSQKQFKAGLKDTLAAIKAQGITPVVIGPIPNPGVDIIQCLSRPLIRTQEASMAACRGLSQAESRARNTEVIAILKRESEQSGALFYDPTNLFCSKGAPICKRVSKDHLLYRDDDHLSLYGARILAGKVLGVINKDKAQRANPSP